MRYRILGLSLAAAIMAPALLRAALCDDTYNLQSVVQTSFEGTDAKALTRTDTKNVSASLSDLQVVDTLMRYAIITGFDGSCTKAPKPVRMKVKPNNAKAFVDSVDMSYQIQMYDSNTLVSGKKYDFWFGFYKPADTLRNVLGRTNAQGNAFVNWYVAVSYLDSVYIDSSGLWGRPHTYFYDLQGPDDSLSLEKGVLDQTIRKLPANTDKRKIHYQVQFLKVSYENKPAPNKLAAPPRDGLASGFRASQTGNLVLIQPGDKSLQGQPLALYGMLGNKIATLHPTGFLYQWNGKTAVGSDAPTGVYFVQAGNRVLGKFFYSR